ncbi:BRO family protein [Xenorhabdus stockiae]|uniref:BRO family protein n=1 Tax=Xenorhabdus stockiae TaxID=351614 RepID=UPI004063F368
MSTALTFKEHEIVPFDNKDGKIWFTSKQMAELLDYAREDSVSRIYDRNKDEFSPDMTMVVNLTVSGEINGLQHKAVRIYSLRGAHLVGMLSKTKVAKALRKWLLDLAEKEHQPHNLALMDMESLKELTIGEMQNRLVSANKWSYENFGQKGSDLMNLRKRHLKKIRKAEKAILELSQLTLPGLDDFPDEEGEPA